MGYYTDLALEIREAENGKDDGVKVTEFISNGVKITRMKIIDERGEKTLCRPCGSYVTIESGSFTGAEYYENETDEVIVAELSALMPKNTKSVLVCGIGNRNFSADSFGPLVADLILATRHIPTKTAKEIGLGDITAVSVIAPGVLGQTGMELFEVIKGTAGQIKPDLIIVADALAARSKDRLGCTVQLSDTGIIPGSGVHNSRCEISQNTLGIPVISIGVPTVIDARTLCDDLSGKENQHIGFGEMIVTPKDTDMLNEHAAKTVANGINRALQPHISKEDMALLVG